MTASQRADFRALPAPSSPELERIVLRIHERTLGYLARRGLLRADADDESTAAPDPTAIEACMRNALSLAGLARVDPRQILEQPRAAPGDRGADPDSDTERFGRRSRGPHVADTLGWSLHAATIVPESDRDALERLLRYFTRPPLARDRLFLLRDGRVAYALRKPWRCDQTHRVMTPLALLARLAALVPPPRHPILRFHGAFAPNSSWRRAVVPLYPPRPHAPPWTCGTNAQPSSHAERCSRGRAEADRAEPKREAGALPAPAAAAPSAAALPKQPKASTLDLSQRRWRLDWATLLWRVHDVDALRCQCGGRLRFTELVTDRAHVSWRLSALGLDDVDDEPIPLAKARDPTFDDWDQRPAGWALSD